MGNTIEKKLLSSVDNTKIIYPQTSSDIVWRLNLDNPITVEASLQALEDKQITVEDLDLSNYVDIINEQTISGQKTFNDNIEGFGNWNTTGTITGSMVYGAVFNDYAEYRECYELKSGLCVCECGNGKLDISKYRLQPGANIISDTFGFAVGQTNQCQTPIAVSGRVLAYPYEEKELYTAGDAVCAGPNGTISKMTREEIREYPERIVGTVSEIPTYNYWGTNNVKVDGRIWIKVK